MQIGDVILKNRFIMAPIKTGFGDKEGNVTERHIRFYERRSGYIAAITPEPFYLDKGLKELPTQIGIDDDNKIAGLKKLTEAIHQKGSIAIAHLNHPGRMINPNIPGNICYSSTDRACESGGAVPKPMSEEDIENAIKLFQDAAIRAEKADFDILELQFGHGYLVAQYLSPKVNDRQDNYGGSFPNRSRLALEILQAVKMVSSLPVIIRVSGDEMAEGGISLDETKQLVKLLEKEGADAVHVSAGTVCSTPPWYFQHMFVPKGKTWELAEQIKNVINIPVITVGQINEAADIEKIVKGEMADFIAVGRAMVADPDFIGKYMQLVPGRIRPCMSCLDGCLGGVKSGQGLGCLINPAVGKEDLMEKATVSKHYAIIGGGLAGMSAAVFLYDRGHKITLFEQHNLGGAFNLASLPPNKSTLKKAVDYFKAEINDRAVEVIYKEAKMDDLTGYDGIIIATGSAPSIPPIKGLENYNWAEILLPENMPHGEKIMIIGGGLIGLETANSLAANDNEIILVELSSQLGNNMLEIEKAQLLKKLQNNNRVKLNTETNIAEIKGNTVYAEKNGEQVVWDGIDRFVLVTGIRSYNPLSGLSGSSDIPVYIIGDADKPAKAQDAITSAYDLALNL